MSTASLALEEHLTLKQIANRWGLKKGETVRPYFINEPGVLKLRAPSVTGRRKTVRLLVPVSIVNRVHDKWSRPLVEIQPRDRGI